MFSRLYKLILKKKLLAGIVLILVAGGGYGIYKLTHKATGDIRYVTSTVEKGMLIVSLSGSGQVSASDQIDIQPKVSGDVTNVAVKVGQEVKIGDLLVQLDSRDAQKSVRDAATAYETAQLELEKLLQPIDDYSLMQSENSLTQAKDSLTKLKFNQESDHQNALNIIQKSEDNLVKAYEDGFSTVANAFLDLTSINTSLSDTLHSQGISESESVCSDDINTTCLINGLDYDNRNKLEMFINSAENDYSSAKAKFDKNIDDYKKTNRYSDRETIEALVGETVETVKALSETVKSEINMLDLWVELRSAENQRIYTKVTAYQTDLKSNTSKINSHLSNLLSTQRSIQDNKETKENSERSLVEMEQNNPLDLAAAERSVTEKEEALAKAQATPDSLDVRAKKIAIQQKSDALYSTRQTLADYSIRAPFDGMVATVNAKKGESVSGSATITLITKQRIAEITMNEVDVAKVKVGQKANITFDAIADLNITGTIVEVDTLGTATQGVVSYGIKIAFDTQDERVKPGMSMSVAIILENKMDVLLVPIVAVKSSTQGSYVEILVDGQPQRKTVTVGSSSDTMTEVVDGLSEGEEIITQTITTSVGTTSSAGANSTNNANRSTGGIGGGGSVMRMF